MYRNISNVESPFIFRTFHGIVHILLTQVVKTPIWCSFCNVLPIVGKAGFWALFCTGINRSCHFIICSCDSMTYEIQFIRFSHCTSLISRLLLPLKFVCPVWQLPLLVFVMTFIVSIVCVCLLWKIILNDYLMCTLNCLYWLLFKTDWDSNPQHRLPCKHANCSSRRTNHSHSAR